MKWIKQIQCICVDAKSIESQIAKTNARITKVPFNARQG